MLLSEELLAKIVLTLRCADADLKGVEERYDSQTVVDRHCMDAANTTREEIKDIYKELTNKEIEE